MKLNLSSFKESNSKITNHQRKSAAILAVGGVAFFILASVSIGLLTASHDQPQWFADYNSIINSPLGIQSVPLAETSGYEMALINSNDQKIIDSNSDVIVTIEKQKLGGDGVGVSGWVVLEVFDKDGNLKWYQEDHNLVVTTGLQALSDLAFGTTHVAGESAAGFDNISVGTDATAPAAGQTDCIAQSGNKKVDASVTNTSLGAVINVSWVAELPAVTLTEICLTDNVTNSTGNLFSRQTFAGVPITGSDTVNAQWTITFADSNGT